MVSPSVSIDEVLMKKTSLFLVVLLWAACSAFAATESYFCVYDDGYSGSIRLLQVSADLVNYESSDGFYHYYASDEWGYISYDYQCFEKWYDPVAEAASKDLPSVVPYDAQSKLQERMSAFGPGAIVVLASNLDFGGLNEDSTACVNPFKPISLTQQGMTFLGQNPDTQELYKIKNFCYIADASTSDEVYAGFFGEISYWSAVQYLHFESPYVKVVNVPDDSPLTVYAGVVVGHVDQSYLRDISISNAMVQAPVAGGFVGLAQDGEMTNLMADGLKVYLTKDVFASENPVVSPDAKNPSLGGVVGNFDGSGTNGVSSAKHIGLKNVDVQNKVSGLKSSEGGDWLAFVGGFAGSSAFTQNDYDGRDFISEAYIRGNVSSVNASDAVGYVTGETHVDEDMYGVFQSIYYLGGSESAPDFAGSFYYGEAIQDAIDEDNEIIFNGMYRNAVGTLASTGSVKNEDPYGMYDGRPFASTGVLTSDEMHSNMFAYALNSTIYDNPPWSRGDDVADGLPYFAEEVSGSRVSFQVSFSVSSYVRENLPSELSAKLARNGDEFDGEVTLNVYTDNKGVPSGAVLDTIIYVMEQGYAWNSSDYGSFTTDKTFDGNAYYSLYGDKEVVVVPLAQWGGEAVTLDKFDGTDLDGFTPYFGFVPNFKVHILDDYETKNFEQVLAPSFMAGNADTLLYFVLNSAAISVNMDGSGEKTLQSVDAMEGEPLSNLSGLWPDDAAMSDIGDTLYLYYTATSDYGSERMQIASEGAWIRPLGYAADDFSKVVPINSPIVYSDADVTYAPYAHAYELGFNADPGHQVDSLEVTLEVVVYPGASSSDSRDFYPDGSEASVGDMFGSVRELQDFLDQDNEITGIWYFRIAAGETLVMDSLFVALSNIKRIKGRESKASISISPYITPIDYQVSFFPAVAKKLFYGEDLLDVYGWYADRIYNVESENPYFPKMYGYDESIGEFVCYDSWRLDTTMAEPVFYAFGDDAAMAFNPDEKNILYPAASECDIYPTRVELLSDGEGEPADAGGTLELRQIIGTEESGYDTVAHEFTLDADNKFSIDVPMEDAGRMYFRVGSKPNEGYVLENVFVLQESADGAEGSAAYDTLYYLDGQTATFVLNQGQDVILAPRFRENRTYYITYDFGGDEETVFYFGEDFNLVKTFTTADNELELPHIFRADSAFAGWTFGRGEDYGMRADDGGFMDEPGKEHGWSYIGYSDVEEFGHGDTLDLTALWTEATGEDVYLNEVVFLNDSVGTVTLTQTVDGKDYVTKVGAEGVSIPNVERYGTTLPFTVGLALNAGYAHNDTLYMTVDGITDTIAVGSEIRLGSLDATFEGNFTHTDYAVSFKHIAGDSVFYAEDWLVDGAWSDDRRYSLSSEEMNFPVIYGMGAAGNTFCYQWSVDTANVESLHSYFDWSLELVEAEMPLVLAPVVGECSEEVITVPVKLALGGDGNPVEGFGTIALTQVVGSEESEFGLDTIAHKFVDDGTGNSIVNVPYAGRWLHFQIEPMPAEGYALDYVVVLTENDAGGYDVRDTLRGADELVLERPVALEPHFTGNRTYYVSYKLEAEDEILYYTSKWAPQDSFTTEDRGLRMPRGLYRTDACLAGWTIENASASAAEDVVPLQEIWYNQMEELGRDSVTMVALWDSTGEFCEVSNVRVRFLDDTAAVVTLTRTVNGVDYDIVVGAEDVLIPQVDEGFPFTVKVVAKDSIIWDGLTMSLAGEMTMIQSGDEIILGKKDVAFTGVFRKLEPQPPLPPLTIDSLPEFAENTHLEVSGNALLFAYGVKHCSETEETVIRITLDGPIAGTTSLKLASEETCNRGWELHPLTPGKYHFKAVALRGFVPNSSVEGDFEIVATIASPGKDSWQMVGLNAVDADSVVMDDDVRFFWWNESKNYGEFWQYYTLTDLSAFENGRGYWYSSLSGRALPLKDSVEIPKDGFKLEWALDSLNSGWNLVSNPFGWEIDLGVSDDADVTFWRWNAETAEYERATSVGPYEAVWAKVGGAVKWSLNVEPVFGENVVITELEFKKENVANSNENPGDMPTLKFEGKSVPLPPAKSKKPEDGGYAGKVDSTGTGSGNDAGKSLAKAANTMEWSIRAILSDGNGKRDSWNVLGVGARNVAWEEPPAGMGNHVNLSIMDGKRSLAKSVKTANASKVTAADNAYEWQVELSASTARMGYLSFEGLDAIGKLGYRVFVTVDGFTQEVAAGSAVEVPLTSLAKTATVRVAAEPRKTLTYALGGLRMVQSGSLLNVTFMASDGLAGSGLTVEVLDLKGKVAARTVGNAVSGANSATLTAPAGGLYMLRVRAGSAQTSGKIVVK